MGVIVEHTGGRGRKLTSAVNSSQLLCNKSRCYPISSLEYFQLLFHRLSTYLLILFLFSSCLILSIREIFPYSISLSFYLQSLRFVLTILSTFLPPTLNLPFDLIFILLMPHSLYLRDFSPIPFACPSVILPISSLSSHHSFNIFFLLTSHSLYLIFCYLLCVLLFYSFYHRFFFHSFILSCILISSNFFSFKSSLILPRFSLFYILFFIFFTLSSSYFVQLYPFFLSPHVLSFSFYPSLRSGFSKT
jgi:hypothetical protein